MHLIPTRTIALDIGTNMGYAEALNNVIVRSGTIRVKDGNERWGQAMVKLWDFLNQLVYKNDYHQNYTLEFCCETVDFHRSVDSAHAYARILGQVEKFTELGKWAFRGYQVKQIKKLFTGNGNAKKTDMCHRCHLLGWKGGALGTDNDNDEADAIAILYVHLAARGETATFSKESTHEYKAAKIHPADFHREVFGETW